MQEEVGSAREELCEDYAYLAGLPEISPEEEHAALGVRRRLPWLLLLFGLGFLVSGAVGLFERVVESLSVIVSFQSLILGMAGNAGTQSLAVTVRTLASAERKGKRAWRLVLRESLVGACNGFLLGVLSFLFVGGYLYLLRGESAALAFSVSLCVGVALFISMWLSGVTGAAIPLLLCRVGVDPAVASGPFITTLGDLVSVFAYYGLAWLLLLGG